MTTKTGMEPIHKSIRVDAPVEQAFATFTERIAQWWPLDRYSVGAGRDGVRTETAAFEGRVGGRLYERMSDGQEATWGEILAWEPPGRIVLTWHPGSEDASRATEIEVLFTPDGDGTRVELEHRGWERLGERAAEARTGYDSGWQSVLGKYEEAASV
jgi:uncharacterized protein YndB with AHSA1/START domain